MKSENMFGGTRVQCRLRFIPQGSVRISVEDNEYEDSLVQLVGEGFEDDLSLDNIHSVLGATDPELQEGAMAEDDVAGTA